jgi:adenine-specific DNA-methyltransferase
VAKANEKEYLTPTRTELVWPGKRTQVERVPLPFQVVETVNQSRATREQTPLLAGLPPPPLFEGKADTSWKNKLIWGDNKYVMASLLQGDSSIGLEPLAGKLDLIYIDPPFATGADFSINMKVGDAEWTKEASVIEEKAYRDTWGRGVASYLQMMHERLLLMRDLLADSGSIFVHLDDHIGHYVKLIMDELFSIENFRNEIIWKRSAGHHDAKQFGRVHDMILFYSKSNKYRFISQFGERDETQDAKFYKHVEPETGRRYCLDNMAAAGTGPPRLFADQSLPPPKGQHWRFSQENIDKFMAEGRILFNRAGVPRVKRYLDEIRGEAIQDIWTDCIMHISRVTDFPTEKSEKMLSRIVEASTIEGGVVADFFCGSGTTMAVAEKLGRRWIGCDLSRFAIQVTRKRLLDIPDCKPFEVLNLGKYERRHWQVNVLNGRQDDNSRAIADYLRFIVALYHAEPLEGYAHLHGQKTGRWVHVGPLRPQSPVLRLWMPCVSARPTATPPSTCWAGNGRWDYTTPSATGRVAWVLTCASSIFPGKSWTSGLLRQAMCASTSWLISRPLCFRTPER